MTNDRFRGWALPLVLLVAHTLLLEAATALELNDAWNDQNASMLVALAVPVVDAPVAWLVGSSADWESEPGTYLLLLKALGGAFWFGVGWVVVRAYRAMRRAPVPPTPATAS